MLIDYDHVPKNAVELLAIQSQQIQVDLREIREMLKTEIDVLYSTGERLNEVITLFTEFLEKLEMFKMIQHKLDVVGDALMHTPYLNSHVKKLLLTGCKLNIEIEKTHILLNEILDENSSYMDIPSEIKAHYGKLDGLLQEYESEQNEIIFDSWFLDIGECD